MEKFTYRNIGMNQSIEIGYQSTPYILLDYEGMSVAEVLPVTHSGYKQNGASIDFLRLGPRIITIRFMDAQNDIGAIYQHKVQTIMSVFSSLYKGMLTYQNDYGTYILDDIIVSVPPTPINKYGVVQEYEVELTAYNPIFRSNTLTQKTLYIRQSSSSSWNGFTYDGTAPAPYWICFSNTAKTIVNPSIKHQYPLYNSTGGHSDVETQIKLINTYGGSGTSGYEVINNEYGNKGHKHVSYYPPSYISTLQRAVFEIGDISPNSTFSYLYPKSLNNFKLEYEASNNTASKDATLMYYSRYIGV